MATKTDIDISGFVRTILLKRRNDRMKKKLIGIIAAAALILASFTAGVYAAKADWLWFTGDVLIEQSDGHVEEIMTILRQVNTDKITAEEALAELEALNPPGLVRQIKELKERIAELNEYIEHLEIELNRANDAVASHNGRTGAAVNETRDYGEEDDAVLEVV